MPHARLKNFTCFLALSAFLAIFAASADAQGAGSIHGTITDPSAASVPNAVVHVTGSGQTRDQATDSRGQYTVSLPVGQYTVRVTAPGFETTTQENIAVTSGQASALDIALQISASASQVDVTADGIGAVSVDPSQNAGAIVMSQTDLVPFPTIPTICRRN